jgi:hypothetical protein
MSDLLDEAVAKVRQLPQDRQDEAAEMLLAMASQEAEERRLSPEQIADLEERLASPPDYATDAEVAAVFRRLTR